VRSGTERQYIVAQNYRVEHSYTTNPNHLRKITDSAIIQSVLSLTLASALTAALSSKFWNCISASRNLVKVAVKKSVVSVKEADSR
jgi:hypothetical protein